MGRNQIDSFRETELLLEQWGRYGRADSNKIGFPGIASFAKGMPRDIESSLALMTDEEAGEIEAAMLMLQERNISAYNVAIYRYLGRLSLRDAAKKLKMGNESARVEWRSAVYFIMGRLI